MIIVAYDVAYSDVKHDLVQFVNRMIKKGWQPQGPVQLSISGEIGGETFPFPGYYQTLIKVRHLGEIHDDGQIEWLDTETR